jgi:biotin-dependent carboxylase-like uncharacterized protein
MDGLAHRLANLMLGNAETAATLEIPLAPARFRFGSRMAFALAGAACRARLEGRALPRVWAGVAEAGQVLELGAIIEGARIYLALPGGIDVPEVLGSRSTQLREAFGGFDGRVLAAGDELEAADESAPPLPDGGLSLDMPPLRAQGQDAIKLRTLPSAEEENFVPAARKAFWSTPYIVSRLSNRQGYRLDGAMLSRKGTDELRSHGIVPGIVQVPGSGQPIIQLADSATMGGYPAIAAVIGPDLWRIGQARPGDQLRFTRVDLDEAEQAEREEADLFDTVRARLATLHAQQRSWA